MVVRKSQLVTEMHRKAGTNLMHGSGSDTFGVERRQSLSQQTTADFPHFVQPRADIKEQPEGGHFFFQAESQFGNNAVSSIDGRPVVVSDCC